MELNTNLGIIVFKPIKDAKDVMSIGPKNQARGTLKYSATIALGIEIIINGFTEVFCLIVVRYGT